MLYIPTNCGNLDFALNAQTLLNGFTEGHLMNLNGPSMTNGGIMHFHNTICNWAYNIPLKFQWVAVIEAINPNFLKNEIIQIGNRYEGKGWDISNSVNDTTRSQVQSIVGCIFAQGVNLPGEKINVEYAGVTEGSRRGFINSPIIAGRTDFEPLQMGFLETNRSFVDGFLRPWSIVVAHRGLIATGNSSSIKAKITIHQLARSGSDARSVIRKSFIFENCAPINIAGESLDYSPSSDFPKIQATFVYSKYYILDTVSQFA